MAIRLTLDELDARHLRAVALAVPRLENARVAAHPGGVPRPDLLEQLVRRRTLLDVPPGEPARVQRAGPRLRDQLLDERPQLLRLRLGRLDRAVLDQGCGEIAHQRELLLARAPELPASLAMPHGRVTPLPRRPAR